MNLEFPATQAPTAEAKEKLVNDRPTSGQYPDAGYDGLSTTAFAGDSAYVSYETQGQGVNYAAYGSYDTGAYGTTAWASQDGYLSTIPTQGAPEDTTGSWDASAWNAQSADYSGYAQYQQPSFGYDTTGEQTGHWAMPGYGTTGTETGAYDATAWNTVAETPAQPEAVYAYEYQPAPEPEPAQQEYAYEATTVGYAYEATQAVVVDSGHQSGFETGFETGTDTYSETAVFEVLSDETPQVPEVPEAPEVPAVHDLPTQAMPVTSAPRSARRTAAKGNGKAGAATKASSSSKNGSGTGGNSRRRNPAKRSALLTVAVPSACVMGVAGVAAASVGGLTGTDRPAEEPTTMAAPDPASVKPVAANTKLDTQMVALSADAGDFADRASRTQERIDLRERQEEEKKKKAEEAAAKEAARPKFAIPVQQHGLSANFGQAGGMWMSVHTGIDFPVSYGTPVMSATDGTVRTQYNSAYGNMAIVTAPDGTETWYCHLSSTKIRGGKVKAGDVIAYSGNSGNSTGPHLHFEVRPGGGSAIDPLSWLRSHGLDPT
ncbi:M23 family metallopeptidase [Streptomyces sp. NBC_01214]|uniref:M23 family metallopeptidase n=1 Tax=Streptomyces sp. NBC_01214 TaxID=2903777 RepID=UPI002251EAE9|nr:M23 family metallopeptidase [Streptomyces sp. NBC_01214]MCX4805227.1 M23 family metallopeptidase [Streptomyces sp. NBC_01214]